MSAKFLYSLSDENPDLKKQIGCMNGIFQLFDRHHFLSGRRIIRQNHKRLPPDQNGKHGIEPKGALQKTTDKNLKKEKQRISTEMSRTSFSSSTCSSLDSNKISQPEPSSSSQTDDFSEVSTKYISKNQPNASLKQIRQSLDLRDIVKDSIYREARELTVKTATKEEPGNQKLKYIDSPRPLQSPKSAKARVSGLNESFQVLAKLREAPRNSNEGKDGSLILAPKDGPRFSYDGRESRDAFKSTIKLKELPRLSLDSRERSIRGSLTGMKSNYLLGDLHRGNGDRNNIQNQQQEPGSCKRPSSVVAKLMGLEAFPDSMSTSGKQMGQIKTCPDVEYDSPLRSSRITDENKKNQNFGSPRNFQKEHISPRLRNADSIKKPTATSKFPIEPAPWRQPDGSRGQTPALKCQETPKRAPNSYPSVYGEIEKRWEDLEFKTPGKDLRALKQILEAMQKTKEMLETRNENHASKFLTQISNSSNLSQSSLSATQRNLRNNIPDSTTIKGTNSSQGFKSPIVIVKPAKLIKKASNCASSVIPTESLSGLHRLQTGDSAGSRKESVDKRTAKDLTPRTNHLRDPSSRHLRPTDKNTSGRTLRSKQTSEEPYPYPITGDITNSGKNSGTVGLELQQKKLGFEKQSRPPIRSSDSSRTRRHMSRQPKESSSPHRKPRPKSPNSQKSYDQLSESSNDARDLSHQEDANSQQSESNFSLASHIDTEVTSTDRSGEINSTSFQQHGQKQKSPAARLKEDRSMADPARTALEQPSPVSVLDATFYRDESPSPVKKLSNAFKDDEDLNFDEAELSSMDLNNLSNCRKPNLSAQNDHIRVEKIQHMVQNLMQMNFIHGEPFIDEIAPIYDSRNPDHRYTLEILSASGLLRDLESGFMTTELHPSGHPVNPSLFLALEQTKSSTRLLSDEQKGTKIAQSKPIEKIQRKLVFDTVNEILVHKLVFEDYSKQWLSPSTPAGKKPRGQHLLRNLFSELNHLQANNSNCSLDDEDDILKSILWKDLRHQSMDWTDCQSEISGIALDVERLVFKDLISEVVHGESAGRRGQPRGHCRKLFSK